MRKSWESWTPREDALVTNMRAAKVAVPDIAHLLGRTNGSVRARIQALQLNGSAHVPRGAFECGQCERTFTTPQGRGQHLRHGCPNAEGNHG